MQQVAYITVLAIMEVYREDRIHSRTASSSSIVHVPPHRPPPLVPSAYDYTYGPRLETGDPKPLPSVPDYMSINGEYETSPDVDISDMIPPQYDDMPGMSKRITLYIMCIQCVDKVGISVPRALKDTLDTALVYPTQPGACLVFTICSSCKIAHYPDASMDVFNIFEKLEMSIALAKTIPLYNAIENEFGYEPHCIGSGAGIICVPIKNISNALSKDCKMHTVHITESRTLKTARMMGGFL